MISTMLSIIIERACQNANCKYIFSSNIMLTHLLDVLPTDINNLLNECPWEPWAMNYNATFVLNHLVKQILAFSFKKSPSHKKFCCDPEILNSSMWIHFPIVNNMIYMALPCFKLLLIHAMFTLCMWHNLLYGTPLF
jgi:hypothetical protein